MAKYLSSGHVYSRALWFCFHLWLPRQTGTSFILRSLCFKTQFHILAFQHIPYIAIRVHTWCSTMMQPAALFFWNILQRPTLRTSTAALDKRFRALFGCPTPIFFFRHVFWVPYKFCRIGAVSFHIALPGDTVFSANTSCFSQLVGASFVSSCLVSLSSIVGPLKGRSTN